MSLNIEQANEPRESSPIRVMQNKPSKRLTDMKASPMPKATPSGRIPKRRPENKKTEVVEIAVNLTSPPDEKK